MWGSGFLRQPATDYRGRSVGETDAAVEAASQEPVGPDLLNRLASTGKSLLDVFQPKPAEAKPAPVEKVWRDREELESTIDSVHEARPFGSSRAEAQAGRSKVKVDPAAIDQEYAAARDHGLAKGYHLYTSAPLPVEVVSTPRSDWYVSPDTLASENQGTELLAPQAQTARQKHEAAMMRHDPDLSLQPMLVSVDAADRAVERTCDELGVKAESVRVQLEALQALTRMYLKAKAREADLTIKLAGEVGQGGGKRGSAALQARNEQTNECLKLKGSMLKDLGSYEDAAHAAARLVSEHQRLVAEYEAAVAAYSAEWDRLQGTQVRRAALEKMVALYDALQDKIMGVELRLTDHVLMGTMEEAERMAAAPGPDGNELRALRAEEGSLVARQKQQKGVLTKVARKAVEAEEAHAKVMRLLGGPGLRSENDPDGGDHHNLEHCKAKAATLAALSAALLAAVDEAYTAAGEHEEMRPIQERVVVQPQTKVVTREVIREVVRNAEPTQHYMRKTPSDAKWEQRTVLVELPDASSPQLGVMLTRDAALQPSVTAEVAEYNRRGKKGRVVERSVETKGGFLVTQVDTSGPSMNLLHAGDILLAANGTSLDGLPPDSEQLKKALTTGCPPDMVEQHKAEAARRGTPPVNGGRSAHVLLQLVRPYVVLPPDEADAVLGRTHVERDRLGNAIDENDTSVVTQLRRTFLGRKAAPTHVTATRYANGDGGLPANQIEALPLGRAK